MKIKLAAIAEQGLVHLGATNCRVVDVVFSQECPPRAVILVSCEGKKPLSILIENAAYKEDLEPFILQKLRDYLTGSE